MEKIAIDGIIELFTHNRQKRDKEKDTY